MKMARSFFCAYYGIKLYHSLESIFVKDTFTFSVEKIKEQILKVLHNGVFSTHHA